MNVLYYGLTCKLPESGNVATGECTQGGYADYAVKVSNVAQIQLAVNLARTLNLRLVIRNTGHDYVGKSVGKGALSIWTHNLKAIQYIQNYESSSYSGPVFKVGAGVQGFELLQAAEKYGVSAIAGICPTVGIFGGYSTGGGHSPLMQLFGTGADQILAMEVVLANGRYVTVTPTTNSDLYWAMLGGGGGTFGIITSAVVKVHRKVPVTVSTWSIMSTGPVTEEKFWAAFRFFYDNMPVYNRAKTYSYFSLMRLGPGLYQWTMNPFFGTDKTVAQSEALLKPFFDKCKELGIDVQPNVTHFDSVYPAYQTAFGNQDYGIGGAGGIAGNRLVPTENWANEQIRNSTFAAVRNAVDNALLLLMYHQHPAEDQNKGINSVNPAFRTEESMIVAVAQVAQQTAEGWLATVDNLHKNVLGPLQKITPGGGAYGNEADVSEVNWQQSFWGENYPRLLQLKQKYDPNMLFYGHHAVGTEGWMIDDKGIVGVQSTNGALCRV